MPIGYRIRASIGDSVYLLQSFDHKKLRLWKNGQSKAFSLFFPVGEVADTLKFQVFGKPDSSIFITGEKSIENKLRHIWEIKNEHQISYLGKAEITSPNNSFTVDRVGNWWMGTHEGLVKITPSMLHFSSDDSGMIKSLHTITEDALGRIWFGGYGTGFSVWDGLHLTKPVLSHVEGVDKSPYSHVMPGSYRNSRGELFFLLDGRPRGLLTSDGKSQWKYYEPGKLDYDFTGYLVTPLSDGQLAVGLSRNGILFIPNQWDSDTKEWKRIPREKGIELLNVQTITEDKHQRLWLGRLSQGVAVYDPQRDTAVTWLLKADNPASFGAISSTMDERDNLWYGANDGLYFISNPEQIDMLKDDVFQLAQKIDLPLMDSSVVTFVKQVGSYLIYGSQKAIGYLDLATFYADRKYPRISILEYGKDIPGSGSEQNAIYQDTKGMLWVGTHTGVIQIDPKSMKWDTTKVEVDWLQFQAGDEIIPLDNNRLKLPVGKRNIRLDYRLGLNPYLYDNVSFDVYVIGAGRDTISRKEETKEEFIAIDYLPPDEYDIVVKAYKDNVLSVEKNMKIEVPKTLNERNLLWVLISLAILLLVSWLFYARFKESKKRQGTSSRTGSKRTRSNANSSDYQFIYAPFYQ